MHYKYNFQRKGKGKKLIQMLVFGGTGCNELSGIFEAVQN